VPTAEYASSVLALAQTFAGGVSHAMGAPWQTPVSQVSFAVHGLSSLQAAPLA
jgi:hypothetical protein